MKNKYWIINLLVLGVLILLYAPSVTAETLMPQKTRSIDLNKTPLKNEKHSVPDQVDLLKESEKDDSQFHSPNINHESQSYEYSKGIYSNLFVGVIVGLLPCLILFLLIYVIRYYLGLSRYRWIKRYAGSGYECLTDSTSNLSLQTNAKSTNHNSDDLS